MSSGTTTLVSCWSAICERLSPLYGKSLFQALGSDLPVILDLTVGL